MKRSIPFILITVFLHLLSCATTPHSNYTKLASFFKKDRGSTSIFTYECPNCNPPDQKAMFVTEKVKLEGENIRYSIIINEDVFEILISPKMVEVTVDSNKSMVWLKFDKYQRKIEDVFIVPDYEKVKGDSKAINDPNAKDPSLGFTSYYMYRVYFSIENDELVLHKDINFKTEKYLSFYISKVSGLYKIIFHSNGPDMEYNKRSK